MPLPVSMLPFIARRLAATIPVLVIAYPLVTVVLPAMFRAAVPEVVRTVLSLI